MTIMSAKRIHATANASTPRERIRTEAGRRLRRHTMREYKQQLPGKRLKYQVVPADTRRNSSRTSVARTYSTAEAARVSFGRRNSTQDQRRSGHQRYIERQHVEVDRL